MKYLVLVLLMIGFVSAVGVDFDCPDEIFVGEEFECSLEVFDGDGVYDVKVELDTERDSVLKIWDGDENDWISGYYYLKEFVGDGEDENVRMIVSERGNYDGVVKLRQGDKREFFDFEMRVSDSESLDGSSALPMDGSTSSDGSLTLSKNDSSLRDGDVVAGVISLGGAVAVSEDEVGDLVYASRDSVVIDYLPYGLCVFLIFVIGILVIDKF